MKALILLALISFGPAPVPTDYQRCVVIHNGPVERPDHYGILYRRKKDIA